MHTPGMAVENRLRTNRRLLRRRRRPQAGQHAARAQHDNCDHQHDPRHKVAPPQPPESAPPRWPVTAPALPMSGCPAKDGGGLS